MKNEYYCFLKDYDKISDITSEYLPEQIDSEMSIDLTREDFYNKIYVSRKISEKILKEIFTSNDQLLFLVGPRGSGKSTVGIRLVKQLKSIDNYVLYLSISKNEANKYLDDRKNLVQFLRETITRDMKGELFYGKEASYAQAQITSYFLCEDLYEYERPSIYNRYFFDQQLKLRQMRQTQTLDFEDIIEWMMRIDHRFHPEILKLQIQVLDLLELTHLCHAIKYILKKEEQVVWIDNIDVFSQEDQIMLIDAIFSIAGSEPELVKFVVAAREENVIRFNHIYDAQNSIQRSTVYISEDDKKEISGLNMPVLSLEHFEEIVQKRLGFTREFQKHTERFSRELLSNPEKGTPSRRKKAEMDLETFTPVITDIKHRYVSVISKKINKVFGSEKVFHLSNNNIRLLLPMNCSFTKYLFERDEQDEDIPQAYYFEESFLKTQLIYWMITTRRDIANEYRYFNIVDYNRSQQDDTNKNKGCFLPFMTLACIWNLCIKNRRQELGTFSSPTIGEVVERFKMISIFDSEDIKQSILKLYDPTSDFTMFIAIESRNRLKSVEQIRDDHRVRITYKGRAALASLCNSFSFLLAMMTISDGNVNELYYLQEKALVKNVYRVMPDLIKIGEMHLTALNRIRCNNYFKNKENWLDVYLDNFGLPLEKEFSRTQKCCKSFGSSPKKTLYFDSLINSIESYSIEIGNSTLIKRFTNLVDEFARLLNRVEKGEFPQDTVIRFNK